MLGAAVIAGACALIVVALAWLLFQARADGGTAQRATDLNTTAEANHAMLVASAARPADRDAVAGRLRDGSF